MTLLNSPALGIRFEIQKLEDRVGQGAYGQSAWVVFWRVVEPTRLAGALLYEGDTALTLQRGEDCYCIGVQGVHENVFQEIMNNLQISREYLTVCAQPHFVRGPGVLREPLMLAGMVGRGGQITSPSGAEVSSHVLGGLKKARSA